MYVALRLSCVCSKQKYAFDVVQLADEIIEVTGES